jgi:hypothetical protein
VGNHLGGVELIPLYDGSRTKINCTITGKSAPDVTLVHNSLVAGATWKQLPARGLDHYPLLCEVDVTYSRLAELDSKLKWDWRNADWEKFQKEVEQTVSYVRPRNLRWSLKKRVTFVFRLYLTLPRIMWGWFGFGTLDDVG